jgi:hypothetical protein
MDKTTLRNLRGKQASKQADLSAPADNRPIENQPGKQSERRATRFQIKPDVSRPSGTGGGIVASADREGQPGVATPDMDHGQDLAQLVWKYFAEEIREAITEVQEAIFAEKVNPQQQPRRQKQ